MPLSDPRCQHYVCNECHKPAEAEANLLSDPGCQHYVCHKPAEAAANLLSEQLLCDELYRDIKEAEKKILARAKAWVDGVWAW
jgi:hypothetical protein